MDKNFHLLAPGVIGAFDITLLLGMSVIHIDSHKIVASLMIFWLIMLLMALFSIIIMYIITTEVGKYYFYKSKPNS